MSRLFVLSREYLLKDFIVVFLIFTSPFMFFLYAISPNNVPEWETSFFHIKLQGTGYEVDEVFWFFSCNLLIIMIFSLWFITCKHWWRYLILLPLLIELNKLSINIYELSNNLFNHRININLILSISLILLLFLISKKLNYYSLSKTINKQIDEEINLLTNKFYNYNKQDYKELKRKLSELRKQKVTLDKKEYLIKLIKLREDFSFNSN